MRKKYHLIILSENGSSLKEVSFSHRQLLFAGLILMAFFLIFSIVVYHYMILRKTYPDTHKLRSALLRQENKLDFQRSKINIFENDIRELRKNLLKLSRYEEKARTIAGIEKTDDGSGNLVGIGGAEPAGHDHGITGGKVEE